jgi:chromosome segregation ATPase
MSRRPVNESIQQLQEVVSTQLWATQQAVQRVEERVEDAQARLVILQADIEALNDRLDRQLVAEDRQVLVTHGVPAGDIDRVIQERRQTPQVTQGSHFEVARVLTYFAEYERWRQEVDEWATEVERWHDTAEGWFEATQNRVRRLQERLQEHWSLDVWERSVNLQERLDLQVRRLQDGWWLHDRVMRQLVRLVVDLADRQDVPVPELMRSWSEEAEAA